MIIDEGNLLFNETFAGGVMNDSHSSIALQYEPAGFTGINSESLYLTSKVGTALTGDFEDVTEIPWYLQMANIKSIVLKDVKHIGKNSFNGANLINEIIIKVLNSACANATNNFNMKLEDLVISECFIHVISLFV